MKCLVLRKLVYNNNFLRVESKYCEEEVWYEETAALNTGEQVLNCMTSTHVSPGNKTI